MSISQNSHLFKNTDLAQIKTTQIE